VTSSETSDADGRRVVLDVAGWRHIIDEHPELALDRDAVLATVAAPDHRGSDPRPGRERYWRRGLGPSRWLMVVVDYGSVPARVVTAYGNRKDPTGSTP
jgi:hypothetical protein